jgi:hypothetical protein
MAGGAEIHMGGGIACCHYYRTVFEYNRIIRIIRTTKVVGALGRKVTRHGR